MDMKLYVELKGRGECFDYCHLGIALICVGGG